MSTLIQDLRYVARSLSRSPVFALTTVAALALGIGANTAIFSCVSALLLHPVSFESLDRIVSVWDSVPRDGRTRAAVAPGDYFEWKSRARGFESLAAYGWWDAALGGDPATGAIPERVVGTVITHEFFRTLRMAPRIGRVFRSDESTVGHDRVVILSDASWRNRYHSDPAIMARPIRINGDDFMVVGVMPPGFDFPMKSAMWTPLSFEPGQERRRDTRTLTVIGRLAPGNTLEHARAELSTIAADIARRFPASNEGHTVTVQLLAEGVLDDLSPRYLTLLTVAVAFVLMIVCANVAGLLIARAAGRRKELALRTALGASPPRIIRLLMVESAVLALLGAALALLLANGMLSLITSSVPLDIRRYIPGFDGIRIDPVVMGFTLLVALATSALFGLAPAVQAARPDVREALNDGTRGTRGTAGRRVRHLLVVGELVVALVMLVGAGLLIRGFQRLGDPGHSFDPRGVLGASVTLSGKRYAAAAERRVFVRDALERFRRLPGVSAAGLCSQLPWGGSAGRHPIEVEGRAESRPGDAQQCASQRVGGDYFRAVRIPILEGRAVDDRDREDVERVVVVSRALARWIAPRGSALGRRVRFPDSSADSSWARIVGVAGDVRLNAYLSDPALVVYTPYAQAPGGYFELALRTSGDPAALAGAVRAQIQGVDPDLPVYDMRRLEDMIRDQLSGPRLSAFIMGILGAFALLLAGIGIYGLVAHTVAQRAYEFGVRRALGASAASVVRLVVGQGLRLALAGLAIGIPAALGVSVLLSRFFNEVSPFEPASLASLAALLMAVVLIASYLPARAATRIEPIVALRCE